MSAHGWAAVANLAGIPYDCLFVSDLADVKAMDKIQSHSTSNASSIVQYAALDALTSDERFLKGHVEEYRKRRDFVVKRLNEMPGFRCYKPEGAFYVFPQIPVTSSEIFADRLLEKAGVAVVPGKGFGRDGHIRISYATSMENIAEGLNRIAGFAGQQAL
jgi:aspartate aminotransferase